MKNIIVDLPDIIRGNKTINKGKIKECRVVNDEEILIGDLGIMQLQEKIVYVPQLITDPEGNIIPDEEGNEQFEAIEKLDDEGNVVTELVDEFVVIHANFYLQVDRLPEYGVNLTTEQLSYIKGEEVEL